LAGGGIFSKQHYGEQMVGKITSIFEARGFGLIRVKGQPKDIFFLARDLSDELLFDIQLIERRVHFTVIDTAKRPRATAIRPEPEPTNASK
jgi:cold shock CspA family protein